MNEAFIRLPRMEALAAFVAVLSQRNPSGKRQATALRPGFLGSVVVTGVFNTRRRMARST